MHGDDDILVAALSALLDALIASSTRVEMDRLGGFVSGEAHTRRRAAWTSASGEHLLDRGLFTELDPQAQRLGDRHHRGEGRVGCG